MFAVGLSEIIILPLFYAITLMISAAVTNRLFGNRADANQASAGDHFPAADPADFAPAVDSSNDKFEVSEAGPYTSPATYAGAPTPIDTATHYVPQPSFFKSWGIGFLISFSVPFLMGGISLVARLIFAGSTATPASAFILVALLSIAGVFGVSTLVLSRLLPTSLPRASVVTVGIILQLATLVLPLLIFVG